MSKSSCISHPENEPLIIISRWHLDYCNQNRVAAEILGIFHLATAKRINIPTPDCTAGDIRRCALLFTSPHSIADALSEMVSSEILHATNFSDMATVEVLRNKTPQKFKVMQGRICAWCAGSTPILHEHHYPIRKQEGGKQTVDICANCHAEFHYLTENTFYSSTFVTLREFERHPLDMEALR